MKANDRRGAFTAAKAIALMLLVAGMLLMSFIVFHGVNIYQQSKSTSDSQGLSSVECVGFLFTISDISSTANSVAFVFKNEISSSDDVHNVTVAAGQERQTVVVFTPPGTSAQVNVQLPVHGNFTVFPDNCGIYPARCKIGGDCAYH